MSKKSGISLQSYSPYSGIEEYCFIEGTSGTAYPGVRIENISFPLTIPAIQAAVCSCLANGDQPAILYQQKPESELLSYWVDQYSLAVKQEIPAFQNLYDPLLTSVADVAALLKKLAEKAIVPHSGFEVAALLETPAGFICGVNVEVSAWSLGLCAERVAISRAVAAGYTEFTSLHIYAPKGDFSSPCGACRQILTEWLPDKIVKLHHGDGSLSTHYTSHLLPYGFTSNSLKK
ncbi:MAG: cytidine deaminase [Balneolaceae bacterium]